MKKKVRRLNKESNIRKWLVILPAIVFLGYYGHYIAYFHGTLFTVPKVQQMAERELEDNFFSQLEKALEDSSLSVAKERVKKALTFFRDHGYSRVEPAYYRELEEVMQTEDIYSFRYIMEKQFVSNKPLRLYMKRKYADRQSYGEFIMFSKLVFIFLLSLCICIVSNFIDQKIK